MDRLRVATVWLGGCSGCHMSLLDVDEWLFDLAEAVDVVYSPLLDVKAFPEDVDVTLVEGAVANEDNLELVRQVRRNSRILVAFGDCAVSGNVTAMRNPVAPPEEILHRLYVEAVDLQGQPPRERGVLPSLLGRARPVHEVVAVDAFVQGCPPSAPEIRAAIERLVEAARSGGASSLPDPLPPPPACGEGEGASETEGRG